MKTYYMSIYGGRRWLFQLGLGKFEGLTLVGILFKETIKGKEWEKSI